ncbi:Fur family transcriptional regulator [Halanaerobacter jeridensis]|uniref:Fe2+ or Zn2+ uptake regulation protein n=1 Tax=Halanaerobacter jeridensis TaxID=706427 RepID=A0A938XPF5_9FIRM|nr:Fur family transcriptional regulator [Halanaerobacter jeridensis]MBM7556512.1 Fe2+ or Zn2+ uptake regulation protein [Halanaerobacter jeridensis]
MDDLAEWKNKLKAEGIRCTKQRINILNILLEQSKPLTAKEIHQKLEDAEISLRLSTIYRTLNLFENKRFIKKLNINDQESKFELMGEVHHHHLVCVNCNQIVPLDCPLQEYEDELSSETGYQIQDHSIKFYGLCPDCQKNDK